MFKPQKVIFDIKQHNNGTTTCNCTAAELLGSDITKSDLCPLVKYCARYHLLMHYNYNQKVHHIDIVPEQHDYYLGVNKETMKQLFDQDIKAMHEMAKGCQYQVKKHNLQSQKG